MNATTRRGKDAKETQKELVHESHESTRIRNSFVKIRVNSWTVLLHFPHCPFACLPFCVLSFFFLPPARAEHPPPNLRLLHSAHYRIYTDLDAPLAEDLSRRMDAMYEEYSRRLADFRAPGAEQPQ